MTPGREELLAQLLTDTTLTANPSAKQGLADMELLFKLLDSYQVMNRVSCPIIFRALSSILIPCIDIIRLVISSRSRLLHWYYLRSGRGGVRSTGFPSQ